MTPRQATLAYVSEAVAPYGLTADDMISPKAGRRYSFVRHMLMSEIYFSRDDMSLPKLGRTLGNRHHTTVLHGILKHESRMAWVEVLKSCNPQNEAEGQ